MIAMLNKPFVRIITESNLNHRDTEWSMDRLAFYPNLQLVNEVSNPISMNMICESYC